MPFIPFPAPATGPRRQDAMTLLRSERHSAALLLAAAILGLLAANSPLGPALLGARDANVGLPAIGLDLSVAHWISDGLLALFFFLVAVELKHELTAGELNSPSKALAPAIAAAGGVLVPAGVYLLVAGGSGYAGGWPVPTATDIAFALGVLAVFGRNLPGGVRVFLLALAILDDLIAILLIAVFFTQEVSLPFLAGAAVAVALFGWLGMRFARNARGLHGLRLAAMILLAVLAWYLVYRSGVHATIAGVALGFALAPRPAARTVHVLEPYSNGIVLPLFAFSAAAVAIPAVGVEELSAPFWGILLALPLGKLVGITLGGWLSGVVSRRRGGYALSLPNVMTVAALGGIGFTVSLLMNELAFARSEEIVDEGTLAVLLGSGLSIVLSAVLLTLRSRHYARRAKMLRIRRAAR
jgi:NhaA family Na+:H+ antiporter